MVYNWKMSNHSNNHHYDDYLDDFQIDIVVHSIDNHVNICKHVDDPAIHIRNLDMDNHNPDNIVVLE